MRSWYRFAAAMVAVGLTTLSLSACSTPASTPTAKSSITVAISSAPTSFAFGALDLGSPTYVWTSLYDTILRIKGDGSIGPEAAKSFSYNAARTELTLTIRSGMTFSNGKKISAETIKDNLEYFKKNGTNASNLQYITDISAPTASQVVLTLSQPDPTLLGSLTRDSGAIADPATFGVKSMALNPISSGAYVLNKKLTVNGSTYTLDRRKGLYNESEYPFKTVVYKVIADATATLNALKSGQIDSGPISQTTVKQAQASNIAIGTTPGGAQYAIYLFDRGGSAIPALKDLRVRQAVNYAIDRTQIVKSLVDGNGTTSTQIFAPGALGYDSDLANAYPFDLAKAKSLMAAAGYAKGFSVTFPSFSYTIPYQPTLTQELGAIGIKVTWKTVQITQLATNIASRTYPMMFSLNGISSTQTDTGQFVTPKGFFNPFNTSNPTVDGLLKQASLASTTDSQKVAYQAISKYLVDNAWMAPIFDTPIQQGTVAGYTYHAPSAVWWPDIRDFTAK